MNQTLVNACECLHTCMCEAEGPKSKVRGGVRDAAQAVLYGMDRLVHKNLCAIKLL